MTNLLKETLESLELNGKTEEDVRFVSGKLRYGEPSAWFSWNEFAENSDFDYDDGFGGAEINQSLKIVGDGWWLERGEYDGSEWWEFKTLPTKPERQITITQDLLKEY